MVPPFWLAPETTAGPITLPPTAAPARDVAADSGDGGGSDAVEETNAPASTGGMKGEDSFTIAAFMVVGALVVTLVIAVMVKQGYGCFKFSDHDHLNHYYAGSVSPPGSPYSMSSPIPLDGRGSAISVQTSRLDGSLAATADMDFHRGKHVGGASLNPRQSASQRPQLGGSPVSWHFATNTAFLNSANA